MQNLSISYSTKTKDVTEFQLEPTVNRCSVDICSKDKFQHIGKTSHNIMLFQHGHERLNDRNKLKQ
jgi:hypothetical protein